MKNEDYEALKAQVCRINGQADIITEIRKRFRENGGTAKLFIHSDKELTETVLTAECVEVLFDHILKNYREYIRGAQDKMNSIIERNAPP